jgi:hypothetical protein
MWLILHGNMDGAICAVRAAKWLMKQPETQIDAILTYGGEWSIYVRRNKASISAWIQDERK